MKYYIGIDIGTSSVKLTCIDENAKVAGAVSYTHLTLPTTERV